MEAGRTLRGYGIIQRSSDGGLHSEKQIDSGRLLEEESSEPSNGLDMRHKGKRENKKGSIPFLTFSSKCHLLIWERLEGMLQDFSSYK